MRVDDKRINRNIMECKGTNEQERRNNKYRINRNIMECKDLRAIPFKSSNNVLIET